MAAVYADMVGYSRLFRLDDGQTVVRLGMILGRIGPVIRRHQGRLVQTAGDSMLIVFHSIIAAVNCAVCIQNELAQETTLGPTTVECISVSVWILGTLLLTDETSTVTASSLRLACRKPVRLVEFVFPKQSMTEVAIA
jgi:adenylate cyclase